MSMARPCRSAFAFLVVHDELEMQQCRGVPALHHLHNSITESSINTVSGTLLEPGNDDTAAQGVRMSFLHTIPHDLEDYWFADESIRETSVTQKLAVLLSERCSDEVNQMPQKSTERDRRRANCLDELPFFFDAHVVVVPGVTAMRQAHPAALPGPESLSPICAGVAVVYAKKFHQALLDPSCKRLHSNVGDVVLEVIIDTIC